jgi:hypothetical protein
MSKTTRKHEAPGKRARRGPKNKPEPDAPRPMLKSRKQQRPNERAKLRKEYL